MPTMSIQTISEAVWRFQDILAIILIASSIQRSKRCFTNTVQDQSELPAHAPTDLQDAKYLYPIAIERSVPALVLSCDRSIVATDRY